MSCRLSEGLTDGLFCLGFSQALPSAAGSCGGEMGELREQVEEQQREFNDLLACLGQESSKVGSSRPAELVSNLNMGCEHRLDQSCRI